MKNLRVLVCGLAIGAMSLSAMAQGAKPATTGDKPAAKQPADGAGRQPRGGGPGGAMGGPALSAEKAKAAWDLEATGVASRLGLKDDQTKALVTAYENARTSHQAASEKARKDMQEKTKDMDQEDRRAAMQDSRKAMEELNKSEREKFTKAVTAAIPGENGTKAAAALGVFNPQWDRMVDTISGFKLDAAKQQGALNSIEEFVAAQAKAMAGAGPDSDRTAMQEAMQANREKLTSALKKNLSDDQLKTFEESLPGMRGQGGGQGGGGRRGQGGAKPGDK